MDFANQVRNARAVCENAIHSVTEPQTDKGRIQNPTVRVRCHSEQINRVYTGAKQVIPLRK